MVYKWIRNAQFSLYPPLCLLCGSPGISKLDICITCLNDLPHNVSCCRICALPLHQHHSDRLVCGNCLRTEPPFDSCHTPFTYSHPISGLISDFKFGGKLHNGSLLAALLINSIETNRLPLPDLIIPVPLHRSRLRERGFNQALELARPLGRHFSIPLDTDSCKRTRATGTQSSLDKKTRRRNVRGAFKLSQKVDSAHVVILDDVVTTGSTVAELARLLKRNRIKRVDVWALARTP